MSDQEQQQSSKAAETEATNEGEGTSEQQPKPSETVDFWKQKAREQEKRAKDNAEAAKRLAEIEEAQKSEAEKAADRIAELERQTSEAQREALRFKVASKYGITDEDADLFLTGSDEETLQKQAERLVGRTDERQRQGNTVPKEGSRPADAKANTADQFAEWAEAQFTH